VRGEEGRVFVVEGRGGVGSPVLEEHVPRAGSKCLVGSFHEFWGGDIRPGREGGACRTRGRRVRPSCRGRVRCARASTGRCFLSGGGWTSVHQLRGR